MYASLLTLGAGIIAAGLGLIVSGVSFQPARVDASNDTPGIVATTGGCILVGLAFVVCALLRVEHTPTLRPITRPASVVGLPAPAAQVSAPGKPKAVLPADTGPVDALFRWFDRGPVAGRYAPLWIDYRVA